MVLVWANTIFVEIVLRVYTTSIPILLLQWNRTFLSLQKNFELVSRSLYYIDMKTYPPWDMCNNDTC